MVFTDEQAAEASAMFKALGDQTRFRIFQYLRACSGPVTVENSGVVRSMEGPTVGEVCCHITGEERATGVISFHLKELRQAKLIVMEKRGKFVVCAVNPVAVSKLARLLAAHGSEEEGSCGSCSAP